MRSEPVTSHYQQKMAHDRCRIVPLLISSKAIKATLVPFLYRDVHITTKRQRDLLFLAPLEYFAHIKTSTLHPCIHTSKEQSPGIGTNMCEVKVGSEDEAAAQSTLEANKWQAKMRSPTGEPVTFRLDAVRLYTVFGGQHNW